MIPFPLRFRSHGFGEGSEHGHVLVEAGSHEVEEDGFHVGGLGGRHFAAIADLEALK